MEKEKLKSGGSESMLVMCTRMMIKDKVEKKKGKKRYDSAVLLRF